MNQVQLIKIINIGRQRLGWDEDLYRATLTRFGGSADAAGHVSLKSLTVMQMSSLLAHQRASGFSAAPAKRPHNTDNRDRGELKKIEALLTDSGKPWAYAESMAVHMYRKERLEFCSPVELRGILVALEKAAIKRLRTSLLPLLRQVGWDWYRAKCAAVMLFGFSPRHDFESNTQGMSQLLRWFRGELAPASPWPPAEDSPSPSGRGLG